MEPLLNHTAPRYGYAYLVASVAGLGAFVLSFVLLAIIPGGQLSQQIAETAPVDMAVYTAAEMHGAAIYAREGCTNCHSEQVRFVPADVARWGPPTEAWETKYDYPQLWGTRRIGPDLAREASVRQDDWQFDHLFNPRHTVADSIMPGYPWLFDGAPDRPTREGQDLVAYLQSLGRARGVSGDDLASNPPSSPSMDMAGSQGGAVLLGRPNANASKAIVDGPPRQFLSGIDAGDWRSAIAHGGDVYAQNCASCHGVAGAGNGPGSAGLLPRPADLTAARFSDGQVSNALWNGVAGSAMPAWRDLSSFDLASLVAYVRTLHSPSAIDTENLAVQIALGQALFDKNCTTCHGSTGAGDGPAAETIAPRPTNFHLKQPDARRAIAVLDVGIPGTSMPSWRSSLTEVERQELATYVRSLYDGQPPLLDGAH